MALICKKGHVIYPIYEADNDFLRDKFCDICGALGISECTQCGKSIQGGHLKDGLIDYPKVPAHCSKCGHSFPWSLSDEDSYLASAARFLIDGEEEDAANILLSCTLEIRYIDTLFSLTDDSEFESVEVVLKGPRASYDTLEKQDHPITKAIKKALEAVLPRSYYLSHLTPQVEINNLDPDWRTELLEIARGKGVHNQAADKAASRVWNNLRFRSASEIQIAKALDRANVLFWPNCRARLGRKGNRLNREADFLICEQGKLGILEVDGDPFHPPSRTAQDHERDRLFKDHGIMLIEHFDATECYNNPDEVVRKFLNLLNLSK